MVGPRGQLCELAQECPPARGSSLTEARWASTFKPPTPVPPRMRRFDPRGTPLPSRPRPTKAFLEWCIPAIPLVAGPRSFAGFSIAHGSVCEFLAAEQCHRCQPGEAKRLEHESSSRLAERPVGSAGDRLAPLRRATDDDPSVKTARGRPP